MLRTSDRFSFFGKLLLCAALLGWPASAHTASAAEPAPVAAPKPPSVSVATASGTLAETILLTGTLVARDEVMVGAEIDGLAITELLAEEGDTARGQVLARLSRDMLDAQFAQNAASLRALAAIAQARNQIAEGQRPAGRRRLRPHPQPGGARQRHHRNAGAAGSRGAGDARPRPGGRRRPAPCPVRQGNGGSAAARNSGPPCPDRDQGPGRRHISRRDALLGALASSAGDPLFRIIGAGTIEVEADVPETSLARLRVGQTALVRPAGMEQPVPARVRLVSPEVNRTSRLGRVRLSVDPVPGLVGAFARGTVEVDRRDGTLVPLSAVLYRPDGPIVQVVRDGIVETRSVTVGLKADAKAEIRRGIDPGRSSHFRHLRATATG